MSTSLRSSLTSLIQGYLNLENADLIKWNVPKHSSQGDLSTNIALVQAKSRGKNPREFAQQIVDKIDWPRDYISKIELAGPGFINLTISPFYYQSIVKQILKAGSEYGISKLGDGEKIIVEFVSANPTGPLNIVSARAAAIGDSLVRILNKTGFAARSEFYVNDAGRQIERLGHSILARIAGDDVPEDGYHGEDVIDLAGMLKDDLNTDSSPLETGLAAALINIGKQKEVLSSYRTDFDSWFHESSLHEQDAPRKTLDSLRARGAAYDKDDATWFAGSKFGDNEDRVIVTSEGRPTYFLPDIAYHLNKAERGFDKAIDLLGPDHHDYINRMKAALTALGKEDFLEAMIVQQVHLYSDGERVKMSKRAGKLVTLKELVDEVGVDVARFFFLQRKSSSPLDFDLDLAKEQSERNPVFYVQYAHTRICGILRQKGCPEPGASDLSTLNSEAEIELIKILEQFQTTLEGAATNREPQRLTQYLHDLATSFHKFYAVSRVVGEPENIAVARATLIQATRIVIAEGLQLLGVSAPEQM